jgi:hypothetical protein
MAPIEAAAFVLAFFVPFHWLVLRHVARLEDPGYLRRHGVVIVSERALQARSAPVGQFMGAPIWGSVTFKGMVYRFERIQPASRREALGPGELFLEPGLVYISN